jgi:hypothetical protein
MKTGKTLTQLAIELERQQESKRDFVADTRRLYMDPVSNDLEIEGMDETFPVKQNAHRQIGEWAKIPAQYYDRMPADLRAVNVNHWMKNDPAKRMVRTMDGDVRAMMSDRYRALDNFDLATAVLPELQKVPEMQIISTELTESRMYIKALFPRIEGDVGLNDPVQSGIVISNSEIGKGSLRVEPLVYRLVCLNGMISGYSQKKYHIGKAIGMDGEASEIYRDETVQQNDKAFWMAVQDTVRAAVDQSGFDKIVAEMKRTKGMLMEADPVTVIERAAKKFSLTEGEGKSVLTHLIEGGDLNGFGLLNALTRTSQDVEDYDRATEFERMGGQIIELNRSQWTELSAAA